MTFVAGLRPAVPRRLGLSLTVPSLLLHWVLLHREVTWPVFASMAASHLLIVLCLWASTARVLSAGKIGDCYVYDGKTALYNGSRATSSEGRQCQAVSQGVPGRIGLDLEHSHCRDTDGSGYTWCWTQVDETSVIPALLKKEACDVPHCPSRGQKASLLETCFVYNPNTQRAMYQGRKATTKTGRQCQQWNEQYPHLHRGRKNFKEAGFGNPRKLANFCRDPDGEGFPWCYTVDPDARWEECDVPYCSGPDLHEGVWDLTKCYVHISREPQPKALYLGTTSVTVSGLPCQPWSQQPSDQISLLMGSEYGVYDVEGLQNFCRDFDGVGKPWCYTMGPHFRREPCPVPACIASSSRGEDVTGIVPAITTTHNNNSKNICNCKNNNNKSNDENSNNTKTERRSPSGASPYSNGSLLEDSLGSQPVSRATILGLACTPTGAAVLAVLLVLLAYRRKVRQLEREAGSAPPPVKEA